jgi:hypothetical protein
MVVKVETVKTDSRHATKSTDKAEFAADKRAASGKKRK